MSAKIVRFGNPILRKTARHLTAAEIKSSEIQALITDMRNINEVKNGVGFAAPQLGESVAAAIIAIHPTKLHPEAELFAATIINPSYQGVGDKLGLWEGCLSSGDGNRVLYGQAERYARIHASWQDETGRHHHETLSGFVAHVFQHETDHLNGILFVDHVRDNQTLMLAGEFMRHVLPSLPKQ